MKLKLLGDKIKIYLFIQEKMESKKDAEKLTNRGLIKDLVTLAPQVYIGFRGRKKILYDLFNRKFIQSELDLFNHYSRYGNLSGITLSGKPMGGSIRAILEYIIEARIRGTIPTAREYRERNPVCEKNPPRIKVERRESVSGEGSWDNVVDASEEDR